LTRSGPRRAGSALVSALALAAGAGGARAPDPPPEVRPGALVRWPGGAVRACSSAGASFEPLDGACLYPIDLLARGEIVLARTTAAGVERRTVRIAAYPYPTEELTVEEKYVAPPPEARARIERERERVAKLWTLATPRRFALPLAPPLAELPASGRFGARRIFNRKPRSPHSGADFSSAPGTPVFAPADATVALAEEQYFAGNAVYLDHGDGLISMAFHLSEIAVGTGEAVRRGQPIGRVGATGRVTGPHLHFAVRWRGARVDPELLLGRAAPVELR
jgi:murein DD-endopeptidase MepM/ murein hydrolase activator NlpD